MEQPNMSYIKSMSGGDEAFEAKLISIIKKEFPEEKTVYYNNINVDNFKQAADNVHKLKHKISILGLEKSYETAVVFENNLIEGSTELQDEFEMILTTITHYLKQL
ncbi:Hpt domain-containing protein [Winogradskyella bathintestinalis]|uniref:Hpt domain-containing protein n=1 Tax=Winogradskyella bathintestinalis TaxID=3035208 RepID=A0ABT7ZQG5_9FLAO|nr:Hpt domain-containing protein [Winogradskyella bathintestinalis]MDN3491249.1 Hpt domain-containing protein [Winogradskyella bathintestinalis]